MILSLQIKMINAEKEMTDLDVKNLIKGEIKEWKRRVECLKK